jgi:hypothetical protein
LNNTFIYDDDYDVGDDNKKRKERIMPLGRSGKTK